MNKTTLEDLTDLGLAVASDKPSDGWYDAHCPAHADENPSLRVNLKTGGVRCMSRGCFGDGAKNGTDVLDLVDYLRDHPPTTPSKDGKRPKAKRGMEAVCAYEYDDEQGTVLYRVVRREDGDGHKDFVQQRPVGKSGWRNGIKDIRRVLFRLPELLDADADAPVYVVEGEKDVLRLMDAGLVATTNPGGAGKWKAEYNDHLKGRRVILLPDNHDTGREHMEHAGEALFDVADEVKIVTLPDLPDKGDVSDWLDAGGTVKELRKLVRDAPRWRPPSAGVWASEIVPEDVKWLWRGRIPRGKHTLLAGDPGLGKSLITTDLVARVTTGAAWADEDPESYSLKRQGSALILSGEDGRKDTIAPRLGQHGADMDRLLVVDLEHYADYVLPQGLPRLEARIRELQRKFPRRPVLVIIDPLEMFITCRNTNNSKEVRDSLAPLEALAARTGAALLGVMHLNKKSSELNPSYRFMGSMAFVAQARVSLLVEFDPSDTATNENDRRRVFAVNKINIRKKPPSLAYRTVDPAPGKVRWEGESPYSARDLLRQSEKSDAPKMDAAIEMLQEMLADGSEAVKTVEGEADALGIGWRTVQSAKKRLGIVSHKHPEKDYWQWSLPAKTAK